MNKYTVTVEVSIEVPVIAHFGDEACDIAEKIIKEHLNVSGKVTKTEAVCWWKEG